MTDVLARDRAALARMTDPAGASVEQAERAGVDRAARAIVAFFRADHGVTDAMAGRICLSHLEKEKLDEPGLKEVLRRVDAELGRVNDFWRTARYPEMRAYLQERGVTWQQVLGHVEPTVGDSMSVFAGFLAGVGAGIGETLKLPWDVGEGLYVLTGSYWDRDLARRRDEFFAAIGKLIEHPAMVVREGVRRWVDEFENLMMELRYFEAGAMLGKLVPDLLDVAFMLAKSPKMILKLAQAAGKLTVGRLKDLVPLAELARYLRKPSGVVKTSTGVTLEKVEDVVVVRGPGDEIVGMIDPKEIAPKDLDDVAKLDGASPPPKDPPAKKPPAERVIDIDDEDFDEAIAKHLDDSVPTAALKAVDIDPERIVAAAEAVLASLKAQGVTWSNARTYGTAIHTAAAEIIRRIYGSTPGLRVFADRPLREFLQLPPDLAETKVREFLAANPDLAKEMKVRKEDLDKAIGDLEPDLAIFSKEAGHLVLWDLAAQHDVGHVKKTVLYAMVARKSLNARLVGVAETYYRYDPAAMPRDRSKLPRDPAVETKAGDLKKPVIKPKPYGP